MASNETVLKWRVELQGADGVKEGLRKINEEVKKGSLTQTEANKVIQSATKDTRNFRAEQNLLTRSFQTAHPALNTFTRSMSTLSSVARAGMNIATTLNTMWIRQSVTSAEASDLTYELAKANRDLNKAIADGDLAGEADALERINSITLKLKAIDMSTFWTNLIDVVTVGSVIISSITTIFTNLMKNPTIYAAIVRVGSLLGGVFSGFFTLVSKTAIAALDWLFPSLTGVNAIKGAAAGGSKLGSIFGLSFAGAVSVAIIAVGAAILAGAVDIMMENVSGQSFVRDLTEKLLGKGKGMSTKDILGINTHNGADLSGKGLFGGPNSYEDYIKGYEGKPVTGKKPEDIEDEVLIFQPLLDLFEKTIPDAFVVLTDGFKSGWEGITNLTNVFGAGLVGGVNNVFSSLITSMNNAIDAYNTAASRIKMSSVARLTFTAATFTPIPMPSVKAATGFNGMVNRPTMFLAGEAGPESVSISPNGGNGGGGITVVVNVQGSILTERELFRRVDENLKNELKKRNFRILQ